MEGERTTFGILRWQNLRWVACFALALTFHGAGAAALLTNWQNDDDLAANAPVIAIDLAPIAVSPNTTPNDAPPDQILSKQQEAQPDPEPEKPIEEAKAEPEPVPEKPPEKVEVPPDPTPQPELAVLPPPKPVEKPQEKKQKRKHKVASVAAAPTAADQKAEQAAAPTAGAAGRQAIENWISQIYAALQRHKRAVSEAPNGGVTLLGFAIDRSGGVHGAHIARSSGSRALDEEALAIVARAAPLPAPPPEKPGVRIAITVPIRYNAR